MASDCLVNDILQELNAAVASLKCFALNYFLNVFPERRGSFSVATILASSASRTLLVSGGIFDPKKNPFFHILSSERCG